MIPTGDPKSGNRSGCTVYCDFGIAERLADARLWLTAATTATPN
jgi:hypothetical protein